jgi:Fe2+ transport system protein B
MESFQNRVKQGLKSGIAKGWSGFVWMIKILVPISFFTVLLDYSGFIDKIDFLLEPVMGLLSLPSMAAIPLIAGMLTGIYGGIASMVMLPFSVEQMTLMAIFLLISHNLIQEGIIQGKSGMHPLKTTLFRLAASVLTVVVVAQFLNMETSAAAIQRTEISKSLPFTAVLKDWGIGTAYLSVKIFFIIMGLMIILGLMKSFNMIPHIVNVLNPVLKMMGLDRRVGILWIAACAFGIAYGAAVIIEEAKEGHLTKEELEKLHLSIGINHSMVEDPALFLPLGIGAFWLWIPRLITAILAVHLFDLWHRIQTKRELRLIRASAK